jgi:hypothetical protein
MKEIIENFLKNPSNIKELNSRSEADLQFELGYFLRKKYEENEEENKVRFEYQFKKFYQEEQPLKKEADICLLNSNVEVDYCIEIKLLKEKPGSTNFFAKCFQDICYLQQLINGNQIKKGYFVFVCTCLEAIEKKRESLGSKFWKVSDTNNLKGNNNELVELKRYKEADLPKTSQKLKKHIQEKTFKEINKKIEYHKVYEDEKFRYVYCIIELNK